MKTTIFLFTLLSTLTYAGVYFLLGSRPDGDLQLLKLLFFLVAAIFIIVNFFVNSQRKIRIIVPPILFALAIFFAGNAGYRTRGWRFQQDRPQLDTALLRALPVIVNWL
jgi:hypothetical protein